MACGAGLYFGQEAPVLLYVIAAVVVLASLSLILTDQFRFPAPYDKSLGPLRHVAERRLANGRTSPWGSS